VTLAVPYIVAGGQITIPLATFNDTGLLAVEAETTLEVTGTEDGGGRWLVRATGVARRAAGPSDLNLAVARRCHPATGSACPGHALSGWLVLPAVRIRGYHETASFEAAAVDDSDD
jgi:hypothetical protein